MAAFAGQGHRVTSLLDAIGRAHDIAHKTAHVAVGPSVMRLHFEAGDEMRQWLSPLIACDPAAAPDASIAVIAGRADLFDHLRPASDHTVQIVENGRFMAHWDPAPVEILHLFDRESRRGLFWIAGEGVPGWVRSRPLLQLFHAALLDTPWVPLHAAAVGIDGSFLALAGGAGAGKTTAALACAMAGWDYAGDDFVLVDSEQSSVAPLYSSARTRANAPALIADLAAETGVAKTEINGDVRSELRLGEHSIGSRIRGGTIRAWLLPQRLGASAPAFSASSVAAAYGALVHVTTMHMPFGRQQMATKVLKALRHTPVYAVDTGRDPVSVPPAFGDLLKSLDK